MGTGMGAAGARVRFDCWFAWRISFCEGGCRSGMGTAMLAKGVLGLSTALSGLLSWTGSVFTLSLLFCLLREKVEMERAGREALEEVLGTGAFSGE